MKLDPSVLTFDADFAFQESDHVARIPVDLTTKDALCAAIQQQLTVPSYFTAGNWDQLFDVLRFPNFELSPGARRDGRTILLHKDIPLLKQDRYEAQIYLETVIESILFLQHRAEEQERSGERGPNEQLIAVFPPESREAIRAVLSEPPPYETWIGIQITSPHPLCSERAPEWSLIQQWIERLDGVTVDCLELSKKERCFLYVTYLRHLDGYYIKSLDFSEPEPRPWILSSPIERGMLTHLLSQEEVSQIVKHVYEQERLPPMSQWYPLTIHEDQLEELARTWYYSDEEEAFVEVHNEMVRNTIFGGMVEMLEQEKALFTLQEWQAVLTHRKAEFTADQRSTALCVLGRSNPRAIYDTLLTSLESPELEERWVSARFLGLAHEEKALPVLLSMLTEDWDHYLHPVEDSWYFHWRCYVPRLLRTWQTQSVLDALYQALVVWMAAEPHFDHDYEYWMLYEVLLGYELGYRDAFELVLALSLNEPHQKFLLISLAQGYFTKSHHIGLHEEIEHLEHRNAHTQAIETDLIQILETKCHLIKEQAHALLQEYYMSSLSF